MSKPRTTYAQVWSGEWQDWSEPFDLSCCGCNLVHGVHARIRDGRIEVKLTEDNRATAQLRRHHGIPARPRKRRKPDAS
jgi:hypothetical protein